MEPGLFVSASSKRTFEDIVSQIRTAIVSGRLKPGDRLPSQRQLQAVFEVSQAPILEALRVLEELQLIEVRRGTNGGAFVRQIDTSQVTKQLQLLLDVKRVSWGELVEFRQAVEGQNAYWAALRAAPEYLERIRGIVAEVKELLENGAPWEAFRTRDARFHMAVAGAARNRVSDAVMKGIMGSLNELLEQVPAGHSERVYADFLEILHAIENRQPEQAQQIMREHIVYFYRTVADSEQDQP